MIDQLSPDIALCFCRSMRRASNRLVKIYGTALAPTGLKPLEFALLAEIRPRAAPTLIELAEAFQFDRHTLRYKLASLEKARLVVIKPDDLDARSRRVSLTAEGVAKLEEATPRWHAAQARVEQIVGPAEAAMLRASANLLAATAS